MRNLDCRSLRRDDSGMALITTLLVMMLISALVAATFAAVTADQRANMAGRDQTQVFAAAHAGLEKLTSDLATYFATDVSPTVSEINALKTLVPAIPDVEYKSAGGVAGSGYDISFEVDGSGNPKTHAGEITAGPYQGFYGLITPYTITVTAASKGGSEVRLRRTLNTVAVPAFQFGVFSESDLTFYAGDNFDFGGRVHTNGNVFLSELVGFTLKFTDRITAFKDVIRMYLSNGRSVSSVGFTGTVNVPTTIGNPGTYRALRYSPNEGSIQGMPGTAANTAWPGLVAQYKSNLLDGDEGAKKLELPLVSQGAKPIDLIRRPALNSNEHTANKPVFDQRYFSQASLRILISDRSTDITNLPTVTGTAPVLLGGVFGGHPTARSVGPTAAATVANSSTTTTIRVVTGPGIPAGFKVPGPMTVGANTNVACTVKTATGFSGCTGLTANVASGASAAVTLASGVVVSSTITAAVTTPASAFNVVSTASFSPGLIWVNGRAVTCTGYDTTLNPQRFTGCAGLSADPSSGDVISTHALSDAGQPLIGGHIKIEKQDAAGNWSDVTAELLGLGIGAANQEGALCADPTPDAVLRIQRLRDNGGWTCSYAGSTSSHDWWPNALYDAREGNYREVATTAQMRLGGVMHYIALDVNNLKRWLAGTIGTTGTAARNNNGYIVYFSDRRGDHDETKTDHPEAGEYGFEDVVNPASSSGAQNQVLDEGENSNGNSVLDRFGETPWDNSTAEDSILDGAAFPFNASGRPWTTLAVADAPAAMVNRQVLFRRALKLINGGIASGVNSLPTSGLTVVAENPVYVQGNYNATTSSTAEPNVPAAIIADAVTVLSNNWRDARSFRHPNDRDERDATTTAYRFAVIAGKNPSFTYPTAGSPQFLFGTDGGAGNFLRLLENWNISGVSINYRGSIISLYFSRQATGTFKYSSNVYNYGDRNFTFDTDFLTPALLPPGTPMFRDINTLTFRQILRPTE
jgi:type II secretory pathway pseudopilin PulG